MSTTTNAIEGLKQLFHSKGANNQDLQDAIDDLTSFQVSVKLPTGSDGNAAAAAANDSVVTTVPVNAKLVKAYLTTTPTITSTAGDTITLNVSTNGTQVVTFDSDNLAAATGVNSVTELTVTTANSFLDAGEACLIVYTMEDNTNNYLEGELVLFFERQ